MGGVAGSSTTVYFLGNNNKIYYESPLPTSSTEDPEEGGYVQTSLITWDIAREGDANGKSATGDLWVATDHVDSPIRAYSTSGTLTHASDILPDARGMAFSSSGGHRYLWVSNPQDNRIYQIDLDGTTGVGESSIETIHQGKISAGTNPFYGSVAISGNGFNSDAVIEIFDVSGHAVAEDTFNGSYIWNGCGQGGVPVPHGVYYARVHDSSGRQSLVSLVKL